MYAEKVGTGKKGTARKFSSKNMPNGALKKQKPKQFNSNDSSSNNSSCAPTFLGLFIYYLYEYSAIF